MKQYLNLVKTVLEEGSPRLDRTGVGTLSTFGQSMRFDLSEGFPLLTTKKLHFKSIAHELIWFLRGDTNIKYLNDNGVTIWNEWADENGELGPIYGAQWRSWVGHCGFKIDQILSVEESIRLDPMSRRHIVSAWNVSELDTMALPPCHMAFQFYVDASRLSCQVYQRSADVFLGVPFNIASYALLVHMMARVTGLFPGELIWVGGDVHLYSNHIPQARVQLARKPTKLPTLILKSSPKHVWEFDYEDIEVIGYKAQPHIKGDIAV